MCKDYVHEGKVKWNEDGKLIIPNGCGIPYRREDGNFQQCIDHFICEGPATGANATVLGSMFIRTLPSVESVLGIDLPAFMHTCASHQEEDQDLEDEELKCSEQEVTKVREVFAVVQADHAACKTDKGKNVWFDGVDVPVCAKPGPSSKTTDVVEEVVSPQVKASGSKAANPPNLGATILKPATATNTPSTSSSSSATTTLFASQPANLSLTQYQYSFPLEDKDADKCVLDHMLDLNISIPMHDLIAVSTDIQKVFKDMTMMKHVTIGALSVNELSSTPEAEDILRCYDRCL